ncbi:diguanylate cyclase [Deinococcus taeanensis]|uniref:GGDEF domain-containing protein n=1 Tax=Deinococcus taeanensis TaxID=2737050 RepID=UPI001CDBC2D5|nr:diguanylate cyclase [Deinococcus taeanensis]UBV43012.1 diguanylate cyclase [Deinococcus taeanensis]
MPPRLRLPLPARLPAGSRGTVFRITQDQRAMSRRVLSVLLVAALLTALYARHDPFEQLALPALSTLLAGVLAAVSLTRTPLRTLHVTGLLGAWTYVLAKVVYVLFIMTSGQGLPTLLGLAPWVLVLLASHMWLLGLRWSGAVNAAAGGSLLALVLARVTQDPAALHSPEVGALVQVLVAGGVLLAGQRSTTNRVMGTMRRDLLGQDAPGRDALTGLPDRRTLEQLLERIYRRSPDGLVVAMIALDRPDLKSGEHGPSFEARLLAHVARVVLGTVRDQDVLGCVAEGQLAIVMHAPDARAARAACERLRVRVASRPLDGVNPTVSVGLVCADGHLDGLALLREAEDTLAAVQALGTNRVLLGPVTPDAGEAGALRAQLA